MKPLHTSKQNDNKFQFLKSPLFNEVSELSKIYLNAEFFLKQSNRTFEMLHFTREFFSLGNEVLEFNAVNNTLKIVEQKLLKRLKKSELIDLSGSICINALYNKNSIQGDTMEPFIGKVILYCTEHEWKINFNL